MTRVFLSYFINERSLIIRCEMSCLQLIVSALELSCNSVNYITFTLKIHFTISSQRFDSEFRVSNSDYFLHFCEYSSYYRKITQIRTYLS